MQKQYSFSPQVVKECQELNLTLAKLNHMANNSARFTHELGNRRYEGFVLDLQGDTVFSIARIEDKVCKCYTCKDTKKVSVFDECEHCEGVGCQQCDAGLVRRFIDCPDCTNLKTKLTRKSI